jgi:RimJ/RimL family protein N-acetyltransferase
MNDVISTSRCELRPLALNQLILALDDPDELERNLGFRLSRSMLAGVTQRALRMKIDKMQQAPLATHLWCTYWVIIIRELGFAAGLVGFKGVPDDQGMVEIGYVLDESVRGWGYMSETVRALCTWAFQDPTCQVIIAPDTLKTNIASHHVLQAAGFVQVGQDEKFIAWELHRQREDHGEKNAK